MRRSLPLSILVLMWLIGLYPITQQESITCGGSEVRQFKADIFVQKNADLLVTERITFSCRPNDLKQSAYRDITTDYPVFHGKFITGFRVLQLLLDDDPVEYHVRRIPYGMRIYFHDLDEAQISETGTYTYTFQYIASRELVFSAGYDRLNWNLIGNGWPVPVKKVLATVHFPPGLPANRVSIDGYTTFAGLHGGADYVYKCYPHCIFLIATKPLRPRERLTMVFLWPKGFIKEHEWWKESIWRCLDHSQIIVLVFGAILMTVLYCLIGILSRSFLFCEMIPSNKPPKGLSPVMARYLRRWRFDNKTLTTAIIDLATTGCVVIQEENGRFILKRQNTVARRPDESAVQEIMEDHNRFELDRKNRKAIRHMKRACRKTLESKKKLLVEKDFISFIYAFYIISLMFLLMLWTENVGWFLASAVAIGLIINIVIYNLVKGISEDGQKTRMQIENFRLFLEGSKKHHVKPIDPRERTLELFERYLPYAVALDVEEAWTAQFKELFGGLRVVGNAMGMSWYTVNDQIFQPGSANLTTTLIKPLTDAL